MQLVQSTSLRSAKLPECLRLFSDWIEIDSTVFIKAQTSLVIVPSGGLVLFLGRLVPKEVDWLAIPGPTYID